MEKPRCRDCKTEILQVTYDSTGGYCMPCRKYREIGMPGQRVRNLDSRNLETTIQKEAVSNDQAELWFNVEPTTTQLHRYLRSRFPEGVVDEALVLLDELSDHFTEDRGRIQSMIVLLCELEGALQADMIPQFIAMANRDKRDFQLSFESRGFFHWENRIIFGQDKTLGANT